MMVWNFISSGFGKTSLCEYLYNNIDGVNVFFRVAYRVTFKGGAG